MVQHRAQCLHSLTDDGLLQFFGHACKRRFIKHAYPVRQTVLRLLGRGAVEQQRRTHLQAMALQHRRVLPHRGKIEGAAVGQPMGRKDFFHRCVDGLGTALAAELTDQLPAGLELGRNVGNQLVLRC